MTRAAHLHRRLERLERLARAAGATPPADGPKLIIVTGGTVPLDAPINFATAIPIHERRRRPGESLDDFKDRARRAGKALGLKCVVLTNERRKPPKGWDD